MAENLTPESVKRTFYYHADANPIGGTIDRPFSGFVPSHASVSLPLVGGFIKKQRKGRKWKDIISYTSESTHVSGSKQDEPEGGPWTTQVSATIEDLNILEIVTADKVVAQLSVSHPHNGGSPTISLVGSQFVNLRVSGVKIDPIIKYDLFADHDGSAETDPAKRYPTHPWPRQEKFLAKVKEQYRNIRESFAERSKGEEIPDWFKPHFHRFDSAQGLDDRDYILCSLFDGIPNVPENFPGTVCGHGIRIPGFGKVFLGEVIVHQGTYTVSMIRAQLGSPVGGALSAAVARSNGTHEP
jgi:hypothetical protein